MAKQKVKVAILEGETMLSNPDLVKYITGFLKGSEFTLTQKPRVQVAQSPAKKSKG